MEPNSAAGIRMGMGTFNLVCVCVCMCVRVPYHAFYIRMTPK